MKMGAQRERQMSRENSTQCGGTTVLYTRKRAEISMNEELVEHIFTTFHDENGNKRNKYISRENGGKENHSII